MPPFAFRGANERKGLGAQCPLRAHCGTCPRGIKAEGRRASPGRPPARRCVCQMRNDLISFGFAGINLCISQVASPHRCPSMRGLCNVRFVRVANLARPVSKVRCSAGMFGNRHRIARLGRLKISTRGRGSLWHGFRLRPRENGKSDSMPRPIADLASARPAFRRPTWPCGAAGRRPYLSGSSPRGLNRSTASRITPMVRSRMCWTDS